MRNKKQLAAKLLKVSPKKVRFLSSALEDIKKAITRSDMRGLIATKKISINKKNEQSRSRANVLAGQKKKGRRKGKGSKKGSKYSVVSRKESWMLKVRAQRNFLKNLRDQELINSKDFRMLYSKSKGGYFRNKRHIKLYLNEHNLIKKNGN